MRHPAHHAGLCYPRAFPVTSALVLLSAVSASISCEPAIPEPPHARRTAHPRPFAAAPALPPNPTVPTVGPTPPPCLPTTNPIESIQLQATAFSDLPGWHADTHGDAVSAFVRSCTRLDAIADDKPIGVDGYSGTAKQWRQACRAARALPTRGADRHAAARAFFESEFTPYRAASSQSGATGTFTGYFVQPLRGAKKPDATYKYPVYRRPPDLVAVDLGRFISDARGRTIWGRVNPKSKALEHYATRREIRQGLLAKRNLEIVWVDDPLDAFFAEIEGSAVVTFADGKQAWLEVEGKTSRPYRAIGKIIRELGAPPGSGSMPGIRKWLNENPDRFDEIINQNESYVFFKYAKQAGAQGSQGVTLVDARSAAVDRAFVAHSAPLWINTVVPAANSSSGVPWQHVVIAQDTGGGIKGPVRADLYLGASAAAADVAGRLNAKGEYTILLPKSVTVPQAFVATPPQAPSAEPTRPSAAQPSTVP